MAKLRTVYICNVLRPNCKRNGTKAKIYSHVEINIHQSCLVEIIEILLQLLHLRLSSDNNTSKCFCIHCQIIEGTQKTAQIVHFLRK